MRYALIAGLTTLAFGCADDFNQFTPVPGAGGTGSAKPGRTVDPEGVEGEKQISGSLCVVQDVRFPENCGSGSLFRADISEVGSDNTTFAKSDGTFVIDTVGGKNTLLATGRSRDFIGYRPGIHRVALTKDRASNVSLPMVPNQLFTNIAIVTVTNPTDGSATLVVNVVRGRDPETDEAFDTPQPVAGISIDPPDGVQIPVAYNTGNALSWSQNPELGVGTAILFNINADIGVADIRITEIPGLDPIRVGTIPVAPDAMTFVTVDVLPPLPDDDDDSDGDDSDPT